MAMPWEQTYETPATGDPQSFKTEYYPAAKKVGDALKVDPDVILGQWGEETGWGKSIVPGTNNLGNIKAKSGEGVSAKDNQTGSKDDYRKYKSTSDFADDYIKLVQKNFPNAVGAGKDVNKFTSGLKGYAEDKAYPEKVSASAKKASQAPVMPWQQTYEKGEAVPQKTPDQPDVGLETKKGKDPNYKEGSSDKATFGESLRDVGQAALGLGSAFAGGALGTVAEAGAMMLPGVTEPKSPLGGLGVDPYKLKQDIQHALSYEPTTAGGKALAETASIPGKVIDYPTHKLVEAVPDQYKGVADVVGNILTANVPKVAGNTVRRVMTGNDKARTAATENVEAFKKTGIKPTLGQVSEGGVTKGAGAPKPVIDEQTKQLAAHAEKTADAVSSTKTPEEAGQVVRDAIQGKKQTKNINMGPQGTLLGGGIQTFETGKKVGGYLDNARSMEESLYNKMYTEVGKNTTWAYPNLFKTLDDLTTQNPNLMATSGGFINRGVLDLKERLGVDAGNLKSLGYEDARWLRSKIGELTDPRQIVPGDTSRISITPAQADALYAAMSEDMMAGVSKLGPKAEAATLKANQFSRNLHHEISTHLQPIMNSKLLKDTFDAATAGTREGAERLNTTWKTLDPLQKDAVSSVFFRELGRKGEAWDVKQFADNYGKMSGEAKQTLFGKPGAQYRKNLDAIAKVANKLSVDEGTWHKLKSYLLTQGPTSLVAGAGVVGGVLSHSVLPVFLAGPMAGFITGNLVRNPAWVDWFTKASSKTKASSIPLLISNLQTREKDMSADDKKETDDYLQKVQKEMGTPNESPNH